MDGVTCGEATTIGRSVRWLLLLGTLLGLVAMHTLGHSGMRMDTPRAASMISDAPMALAAVELPQVGAAGAATVPDCADNHCNDHAMSGWSICLAVLYGLVIVALLAALLVAWRRERGRVGGTPSSAPGVPRAPPARLRGLVIASTAVLRI